MYRVAGAMAQCMSMACASRCTTVTCKRRTNARATRRSVRGACSAARGTKRVRSTNITTAPGRPKFGLRRSEYGFTVWALQASMSQESSVSELEIAKEYSVVLADTDDCR